MNGERARPGALDHDQPTRRREYRAAPTLQLRVAPEELVALHLEVFSPADEVRLLDALSADRQRIALELLDGLDDAISILEQRARRWRWTPAEVEGRQAA